MAARLSSISVKAYGAKNTSANSRTVPNTSNPNGKYFNMRVTPMAEYGGNKYGGGKFGGGRFGGARFGKSSKKEEERVSELPELKHDEMFGKKSKPAAGGRGMTSSANAGESSVPKMARATGKGGRAAGSAMAKPKGNPFKSGKYAAKGMAPVQAAAKAAKKAKPKADIGSLANWETKVNKSYRGSREELGDFYLNATSGMFSDKAGGRRPKK